ncbi:PAS domain-containing protein [Bradyrhizobium sp. LM3.6]
MHAAKRARRPLVGLSQLALDHMEQGVCVYDVANRIVLVNQRYLTLFNMSAEIVRVGTSYRDVLAHSAELGNFPANDLDALYARRMKQIADGQPFRTEQHLASGLVMALELKPLPGGGWMTICDDVSRLARLEAELHVQTERSQHALANMSHGLIMYDSDSRVVVCNERFLNLYNLDPGNREAGRHAPQGHRSLAFARQPARDVGRGIPRHQAEGRVRQEGKNPTGDALRRTDGAGGLPFPARRRLGDGA